MVNSGVLFSKRQADSAPMNKNDGAKRISSEKAQEWFEEAEKEHVKEHLSNQQKFYDLVRESARILFQAKSIFPFDLFPDEISIDPIKVNIVSHEFFASARVHCIYIKNISDVFVDCSPFFASLKIIDQGFTENEEIVTTLSKDNAMKARRIIQGLVVAHKQGVDVTRLEQDTDLVEKLEALGDAK